MPRMDDLSQYSNTSFANPGKLANKSQGPAPTAGGSKKYAATSNAAIVTGIPGLDAMLAGFMKQIAAAGKQGRKSLLLAKKTLKSQNKATAAESALAQAQLAALNVQPAPQVASLSSPEVLMTRRQTAIDAGSRNGLRKSILAGNNV